MSEHPILFNSEMVRAILNGRKTQTRRLLGLNHINNPVFVLPKGYFFGPHRADPEKWAVWNNITSWNGKQTNLIPAFKCPYGKIGDMLWVKEKHVIESSHGLDNYSPPHSDGRPIRKYLNLDGGIDYWEQPHYAATDPTPELNYDDMDEPGCRWKPSIHMPRWASRVTLEITDIRLERLQAITNEDAEAEGVLASGNDTAKQAFEKIWAQINGTGSWNINPWVWVIEFKPVKM